MSKKLSFLKIFSSPAAIEHGVAMLTLFIAMFSIQAGASLAKKIFPLVGAAGATSLRLAFAAFILAAVWRPWRFRLSLSHLKIIFKYGVSLGLMNLSFYFALERLPLGIVVALEFTGPLALAFISVRKPAELIWTALAILGIILILPVYEFTPQRLDPLGISFALCAGACWAGYILFGKTAGNSTIISSGAVTSMGMIIAASITLPFGLVSNGIGLFNPKIFLLATGIALLSSAIPYSLEMFALKKMPTSTFSVVMSLEPALAALSGFLFLKESLSVYQSLAIACIMSASLGTSLSSINASNH